MPKRDYDLSPVILRFVLRITFFGCGGIMFYVPIGPVPICFVLAAGFLSLLTTQARGRRQLIEAIERSRPGADELAEALRAAARKTRAEQAPPPVPAERS